jgi:hypothetical protein
MNRDLTLAILALFLLALAFLLVSSNPPLAWAQKPLPPNNPPPSKTVRIDAITTGTVVKNVFTTATAFARGSTVVVRAHAVNQSDANLNNVSVSLKVNKPDGSAQCTLSGKTDSGGNAQISCAIPSSAPVGTWSVQVASFSLSGYTPNTAPSVTSTTFTVK